MSVLGTRLVNLVQTRTAWLWLLMVGWSGFVAYRAWVELESNPTVEGLHRTYLAPYEHELGSVIDPRQNGLIHEIGQRYAPDRQVQDGAVSRSDYEVALSHLGLQVEASNENLGAHSDPHLRTTKTGHGDHLFIGQFGLEFVLFYPDLGVVLTRDLPRADEQIRLVGATEAPW